MAPVPAPAAGTDLAALLAAMRGVSPAIAHRRPDPGIDRDDEDEESDRPIGDPDEDEGVDEDEDDDDDEEPLQV